MSTSLCGEITEISKTLFQHPGLPHRLQALSQIGYAITDGNISVIEQIMMNERDWILNEFDGAGATSLVRSI